MSFKHAVENASELALEEGDVQVVGKIQGSWTVANVNDEGRLAQMSEPKFRVSAEGVIHPIAQTIEDASRDATDAMIVAEDISVDFTQDWDNETTTWTFQDGSKLVVSGPEYSAT